MTTTQAKTNGDRHDAAMNWLIRLREEPEAQEVAHAFADWLAATPENRAAWEEVQQIWSLVGEVGERPAVESGPASVTAFDRPTGKSTVPGPSAQDRMAGKQRRRYGGAAAGLALAASLLVAAVLAPGLMLQLKSDFNTGTGETTRAVLPDGSTLTLAANSAVAVNYTVDERQIELLNGAVFAEVEPDAERPFFIRADGIRGTALGTAYEVRKDADSATVTVEHGIVGVTVDGTDRRHELTAAQWITLSHEGGAVTNGLATPRTVASWRHGQFSVDGLPLDAVIDQLSDYYDGSVITLGDLSDFQVTGVYNLDNAEGALRAAIYPHGLKLHRISPWILVISKI